MSRATLEDDSSDRLVFIYSPDGSTGYQVGRRSRSAISNPRSSALTEVCWTRPSPPPDCRRRGQFRVDKMPLTICRESSAAPVENSVSFDTRVMSRNHAAIHFVRAAAPRRTRERPARRG